MDKIKIYCLDNSEMFDFESKSRGYRSDIYVLINNEFYNLNIYDIVRLQQDFETELGEYGFFSIEVNIVIVKDVTMENIKLTIYKLFAQKYFDKIKPCVVKEIEFEKMQEIV